ncbi:hypothetical protein BH09ACT12_BH09ACT12_34730 [soil metagenome]
MITSQDFFALVVRHLTVAMLEAHYVKIGEYAETRSSPTSGLLSSGHAWPRRSRFSSWLRKHRGEPKVAALEVGYEGSFDGDEQWIRYYPETCELDLGDWRDTLDGHADWDVWHDRLVQDKAELERRLMVLGAAIRGQRD